MTDYSIGNIGSNRKQQNLLSRLGKIKNCRDNSTKKNDEIILFQGFSSGFARLNLMVCEMRDNVRIVFVLYNASFWICAKQLKLFLGCFTNGPRDQG